MISPGEDKRAIKKIVESDPFLKRAGVKPDKVLTTRYGVDTLNSVDRDIQVFIYNSVHQNIRNEIQRGVVYNVAVAWNRVKASTVDTVSQQIIALLNDREIGNGGAHILQLQTTPIELVSDPAIYIVETSFVCYETIFNQIKT